MSNWEIVHGDCLDVLKARPDNSIDSIVTDPPYGLSAHKTGEVSACLVAWVAGEIYAPKGKGFMGKAWDAWVPGPELWRECYRVLKPGGHLLSFGGTRSYDLMAIAIRLAGFEVRDQIQWVYGEGMPKSMDVSKAIDAHHGAEREVVGERDTFTGANKDRNTFVASPRIMPVTVPATPNAERWKGWGTGLKPASEPVCMARKPLSGTVAETVLEWGTGAINIDGCRVTVTDGATLGRHNKEGDNGWKNSSGGSTRATYDPVAASGRWPANVLHDGSEEVTRLFPNTASGAYKGPTARRRNGHKLNPDGNTGASNAPDNYGDAGNAARFFYAAKPSKRERSAGLPAGMINTHPTVKSIALMRYLVRLVTPPGGIVLDPFAGSGSTGCAAVLEGFGFMGIEQDADSVEIARLRVEHWANMQTVEEPTLFDLGDTE